MPGLSPSIDREVLDGPPFATVVAQSEDGDRAEVKTKREIMPSHELDRTMIPLEIAAATSHVPPLRYPARNADGQYLPKWMNLVSPVDYDRMVQDTPPPLSLSVLLDDEFKVPTPAAVVPDKAMTVTDRRRARMLRHKKIPLHEADDDAVAAAVATNTTAEALRPVAGPSIAGLRSGGAHPHLGHQMMLDSEELQSQAVPTTRRSISDVEEDLHKTIADIFTEDRSKGYISSSSDRDRDRDTPQVPSFSPFFSF